VALSAKLVGNPIAGVVPREPMHRTSNAVAFNRKTEYRFSNLSAPDLAATSTAASRSDHWTVRIVWLWAAKLQLLAL
jgi:hypothetical protein